MIELIINGKLKERKVEPKRYRREKEMTLTKRIYFMLSAISMVSMH